MTGGKLTSNLPKTPPLVVPSTQTSLVESPTKVETKKTSQPQKTSDEITGQSVRQGLEAQVSNLSDEQRLETEDFLRTQPIKNRSGGALVKSPSGALVKQERPMSDLRTQMREMRGQIAETVDQPSLAKETLQALGPEIETALFRTALILWRDPKIQQAVGKSVAGTIGTKEGAKALSQAVASNLSQQLGLKLVNEEFVTQALKVLPQASKKLGIKGGEKAAKSIGKALLKEGAEAALEEGAKTGAKKGIMGVLSSIPVANVIPMMFTGAELVHEFTKDPPDKRAIGKGLAVLGLQLGAIAFPPLGLAATAVDLTGSVAIAVSDAHAEGLSAEERIAAGQDVAAFKSMASADLQEAIEDGAGLTESGLYALSKLFHDQGYTNYANRAGELAEFAGEVDDEEGANLLASQMGHFGFEVFTPYLLDKIGMISAKDDEDFQDAWSNVNQGFRGLKDVYTALPKNEDEVMKDQRADLFVQHLFKSVAQIQSGTHELMQS